MFSEAFNDMEADVMRLYIMLRHDVYPEKKFQSGCFNCSKSWGFSLLKKHTQCPLIFKAIFGFI